MDSKDLFDFERSEGEGNEGSDLVADFKVAILKIFADVCNFADEHAAGTGNGVLLLAALCNDAHDHFADLLLVAAACFFNLSE